MKGFTFSSEIIERIGHQFEHEMDLSLNEELENSSLQMENTYIPELPDGTGKMYHLTTQFHIEINFSFAYRKW